MAPEDIWLGMFGAIHNDRKVIAAVIDYAYLHDKTTEQLYTILGRDFKAQKRDRGDTATVCAKTYISNVCQRIEELFHLSLKSCESPMASDDHPEVANSGLFNNDEHSR